MQTDVRANDIKDWDLERLPNPISRKYSRSKVTYFFLLKTPKNSLFIMNTQYTCILLVFLYFNSFGSLFAYILFNLMKVSVKPFVVA